MQEQDPRIPSGLQELESAIGKLRPTRSGIEGADLMFRAGAASARRRKFFWPALSAVLAVSLTASLAYRPGPAAERVVYVQAPAPTMQPAWESPDGAALTLADGNYLKLRDDVLSRGLEALPEPAGAGVKGQGDDLGAMMRQYGLDAGGRPKM